jgi:hypothetical protein
MTAAFVAAVTVCRIGSGASHPFIWCTVGVASNEAAA